MIRSKRRLARAAGAEQRRELAVGDLEAHVAQRGEGPVGLADVLDGDAHELLPFHDRLDRQGHQGQHRQQRGHREGRHEIVLVVQDLHLQRNGVRLAPDVAGDDGDRAELAHRARVAEDHAVEQGPAHVGQGDAPERLPARGAEREGRLLVLGALFLHQRDQLARDERQGHEDGRQHDAGHREDHLQVVGGEPRPEPAVQAEHQHVDHARDDRRHGQRQVDERRQDALAGELELRDRPGRRQPEDQVQRHRDGRGEQRELDRRQDGRVAEARRSTRRRPCGRPRGRRRAAASGGTRPGTAA